MRSGTVIAGWIVAVGMISGPGSPPAGVLLPQPRTSVPQAAPPAESLGGRVLRRIGRSMMTWLFMLAGPTLRRFTRAH